MNRRQIVQWLAGIAPAALCPGVHAQESPFPSKPIRVIAGSVPGTLVDQAARMYAERMSAYLRQPVLVENLAGASTLLAIRQTIKSPADGYTLLVAANTVVTVPHTNPKAGYAVKDLAAVGEMVRSPVLLVTSAAGPFKSVRDLVEAARRNPGQVSFGSSGIGTTNHLAVGLLARQAGVTFTHVPYKGIAAAVPDVAAGRVSFLMGAANSVAELMKSGTLRAMGISADRRSPQFPDVPTMKELGFGDATFEVWIGALAPAGLPGPVLDRLGEAMEAARRDPDLVRRLEAAGQEISAVRTPAQFEAVLRTDEVKLRRLIKDLNIVAE